MASCFRADRLRDDLAVPHLVDVRVHQAGDQGLAEAEAGFHGGNLPVARDGVGREQDAGRLREDHLLHDHGHVDLPLVEAVPQAVGHGPLGEERGPAPADVLEDRRRPHDVQVRVLLAREGGRRQVLRRRTGSDGVGGLLAEPGERAGDRRRQIVGDGDPFEGPADLRAERADRLPVVRLQARQPIEPIVDRRRFRHDPPEGVRRHAKASRHADAFDPRKLPQVRALAANDRDLRPVDLLETQHVAAHPLTWFATHAPHRESPSRPPSRLTCPWTEFGVGASPPPKGDGVHCAPRRMTIQTADLERPEPAVAPAGHRLHALDALRGFALLLGVVLHAAIVYVPGFSAWPLVDRSTSIPLAILLYVIHLFRMTMFFVIAGFFARLLVQRRGVRAFVRNRGGRIVVPLIVGWFMVFPLVIAVMRWALGDLLPRRAAVIASHHLWFLYVLTLLYVGVLAVRALMESVIDTGGRLRAGLDAAFRVAMQGPWAAFVLGAPLAIAFLGSRWRLWSGVPTPDRSLVPNLPAAAAYSVAFLAGWLLHRQPQLLKSTQRQSAVQLALASALTVGCLWMVGVTRSNERAAIDLRTASYSLLYSAAGWAWTLALIGIALRFFGAESPIRRYVSDASYWVYLAHYPVVIALQAAMLDLPWHWSVKFPAQLTVALGLLFATYHSLVRFTWLGEALNGTRRRGRSRAEAGAM